MKMCRVLIASLLATVALVAGGAGGYPAGASAATDESVTPLSELVPAGWLGECTDQLTDDFPAYLRQFSELTLTGNNKSLAWNWYPFGMSMLNMYELTGEEIYLLDFMDAYNQIIARVDSATGQQDQYRGRITNAWGFLDPGHGSWTTTTAVTGRIAEAGLRFARIAPAGYEEIANEYRQVAMAAVAEFADEYRRWKGRGYYFDPVQRKPEPINHAHVLGDALLEIYRYDGSYRDEIVGIARWFKWSKWKQKGDAWAWTYRPDPGNRRKGRPDRTIKATIAIRFPVGAAREGVGFRQAALEPLVNTVIAHVMRPKGVNRYISRDKFKRMGGPPERNSVVRFADLDRVDRRIGSRIIRLVRSQCGSFPRSWLTDKHTTIALTELLLSRK